MIIAFRKTYVETFISHLLNTNKKSLYRNNDDSPSHICDYDTPFPIIRAFDLCYFLCHTPLVI